MSNSSSIPSVRSFLSKSLFCRSFDRASVRALIPILVLAILPGFVPVAAGETLLGEVTEVKSAFCKVKLRAIDDDPRGGIDRVQKGDEGQLVPSGDAQAAEAGEVVAIKTDYVVVRFHRAKPKLGDVIEFTPGDRAAAKPDMMDALKPTLPRDPDLSLQPADEEVAEDAVSVGPAMEKKGPAEEFTLMPDLDAVVGQPIEVVLRTQKLFEDVQLVRVFKRKGKIQSLRIDAGGRQMTIGFKSILSIKQQERVLYTATDVSASKKAPRKTKAMMFAEKVEEQKAASDAEWEKLIKTTGVRLWPQPSAQQQEAALQAHMQKVDKIKNAFPNMTLYQTEHFLFLTNIPRPQVAPYVRQLDAMHALLKKMYQIPDEDPVWLGKALIVAFTERQSFVNYERTFEQNAAPPQVNGLCHSNSSGDVVVSCFQGQDPASFAQLLVHETSHGFLHRYRTAVRLPSWVNEGLAEYVAHRIVPSGKTVTGKQDRELKRVASTRTLGGVINDGQLGQEFSGYGVASSMVTFLINTDATKFAQYVNYLKGGMPPPESLMQSYGVTTEQLVTAFGRSIGVPDLRP